MEQASKGAVLIVDDEVNILRAVSRMLGREGFHVATAENGSQALELLTADTFDVALVDITMPGMSGLDLLKRIRELKLSTEVVIMTGAPSVDRALTAMKDGAYDFLQKPFTDTRKLCLLIERAAEKNHMRSEVERLRQQVGSSTDFQEFVGSSPVMHALYNDIRTFAWSSAPVLITGESGSGKELVARAIHRLSRRHDGAFLAINAAATPEGLAESILFGHKKGSFANAISDHQGFIEVSDGGTLFIDEIGELPAMVQPKLLRFLSSGEFIRVGESRTRISNVRIVAATSRLLEKEVQNESFQDPLFNRLNVLRIHVPPLRERQEDVPALAYHFLRESAKQDGHRVTGVSPEAMALLQSCSWRGGNVRKLSNAIQYAVTRAAEGELLRPEHLPAYVLENQTEVSVPRSSAFPYVQELTHKPYQDAKKEAETHFARFYFGEVLRRCGGVINRTAREVGIEPPNLRKKLKEIQLDARAFRSSNDASAEDSE